MILHDSPWAPSPRRVRMFLAEKGISVERRVIDLRTGEHLSPEYLAINPRGAVPILELDDGEVISESSAICRYFEALHPEPALFGTTAIEQARIECWTRRIESEGYAAAVYVLRNGVPAFEDKGLPGKWPAIPQIVELTERGRTMWRCFMDVFDAQLAEREWVTGGRYSFADITALATIDFAARMKLTVPDDAGHVQRWHAAASARPSAQA